MWLRTKNGFYVHELRGVVYVSWVFEKDREHAAIFPTKDIEKWRDTIADMTGFELDIVQSNVPNSLMASLIHHHKPIQAEEDL